MPTLRNYLSSLRCGVITGSILLLGHASLYAQSDASVAQTEGQAASAVKTEVVLASEVKWQHLNPARGDASPAAGTLWGDQTQDGESGFLVKFRDGFASPPHIHNITYRGIVIDGALHNDDPEAQLMWMPAGSWWTQPAGEVHITAARTHSIGYVEIQSGPYLVQPPSEASDNGERPVNMDVSNIVWQNATDTDWIAGEVKADASENAMLTFLWGQPDGKEAVGTMLKLPASFQGQLSTDSSSLRVVVVQGELDLQVDDNGIEKTLPTGSYFGANGPSEHRLSSEEGCVIYVRVKGKYSLNPR
ncbi:MAG: DUF4437 domain-containing protein [Rubinisphaera brasiliensis]|uniref:DUF4437 domain-containing protein n=1 Tax=Rubinisphaera brasiliensis TaxID=119 RepID=UPI00391C56DC